MVATDARRVSNVLVVFLSYSPHTRVGSGLAAAVVVCFIFAGVPLSPAAKGEGGPVLYE